MSKKKTKVNTVAAGGKIDLKEAGIPDRTHRIKLDITNKKYLLTYSNDTKEIVFMNPSIAEIYLSKIRKAVIAGRPVRIKNVEEVK